MSESSIPPHLERWRTTWTSFCQALRSTQNEFDSWHWVCQLGFGLTDYLYHALLLRQWNLCGFTVQLLPFPRHFHPFFNQFCRGIFPLIWRPLIPALAILLILFSLSSYFLSLQVHLVRQRWCSTSATTVAVTDPSANPVPIPCTWEYIHTTIVSYLGIMILYTYITVIFQSPGVALPLQTSSSTTTREMSNSTATTIDNSWRTSHCPGGILGWNSTMDVAAEQRRVDLYGPMQKGEKGDDDDDLLLYPSTNFTFCTKCNIWRPPRCHHCSTCRRCVLQMDHHCPWVNNCIGYNNIQIFVLSLTYLVLGCWYGTYLVAKPFFEVMNQQIAQHGWKLLYSHGTGFLDLPGPWETMSQILTGTLPPESRIKTLFPLLAGVGTVLTIFWAIHIRNILSAYTTLENTAVLTMMNNRALLVLRSRSKEKIVQPSNPYDQGWRKNLLQILGANPFSFLIPIPFTSPPAPYIPPPKSKDR